jgi:hypothetical protein
MKTVEIRGKRFGSTPCVFTPDGTPIDAIAAICDQERWISCREDIKTWLVTKGLTVVEALLLIELGIAQDAAIPSLQYQDVVGGYQEEVGKIVDSIEDDCKAKRASGSTRVYAEVNKCCHDSKYVCVTSLAAITLQHSKWPTTWLAALKHPGLMALYPWNGGATPFPFADFAKVAMVRDCIDLLSQRPGFERLKPAK